jgi:hypothetical protein
LSGVSLTSAASQSGLGSLTRVAYSGPWQLTMTSLLDRDRGPPVAMPFEPRSADDVRGASLRADRRLRRRRPPPHPHLRLVTHQHGGGLDRGIYYAAYTLVVPVLSSLADRVDPKRIYLGSVALTAVAFTGFAWAATGFWSALASRALMGGLLLADRRQRRQRRAGPPRRDAGPPFNARLRRRLPGTAGPRRDARSRRRRKRDRLGSRVRPCHPRAAGGVAWVVWLRPADLAGDRSVVAAPRVAANTPRQ